MPNVASELELISRKLAVVKEAADIAATSETARKIDVLTKVYGSLTAGDADTFKMSMKAGEQYLLTVNGSGGNTVALHDSVITVRDASGNVVAVADDVSRANKFSFLKFTPSEAGDYFVTVSSKSASDAGYIQNLTTGKYVLEVSDRVGSLDVLVDQMTEFGWDRAGGQIAWDLSGGRALSFSFDNIPVDMREMFTTAFQIWTDMTGIAFKHVTGSVADITFQTTGGGAFAQVRQYETVIQSATINISAEWFSAYGFSMNGTTIEAAIHEIGHVLGLWHPGRYNFMVESYEVDSVVAIDTAQYSNMSYFLNQEMASVVLSPMMAEILAMEKLYGNLEFQMGSGNTVWGQGNTVSGYYGTIQKIAFDDQNPAGYEDIDIVAFTVRDAGGIDTIDFSKSAHADYIDLRDMASSSVLGRVDNLMIAKGTMIENAKSGDGNDTVIGNELSNTISGGNAGDVISGENGADILFGENGNDRIYGGWGNDTIHGGNGHDVLNGGKGNDVMRGNAGNDTMTGSLGSDVFVFTTDTGSNRDHVTDFDAGHDDLVLRGVEQSKVSLSYAEAGAVISFYDDSILLLGETQDSFRFLDISFG